MQQLELFEKSKTDLRSGEFLEFWVPEFQQWFIDQVSGHLGKRLVGHETQSFEGCEFEVFGATDLIASDLSICLSFSPTIGGDRVACLIDYRLRAE